MNMGGYEGVGLRGGRFTTRGYMRVGFELHDVRWVQDVAVSGTVLWDRSTGAIRARVTIRGPNTPDGSLSMAWNDFRTQPIASIRGRLGGVRVAYELPAP
jgi:hypothetical protein